MNKKNNLEKICISFSLLSILVASCGKNTPVIETTHQNSKLSFELKVTPSANYEAQPNSQTIIIPESGCVILNSFATSNNNKKQLHFENIKLYSSSLEHFQLNHNTNTLCHTSTLASNETDAAELVLSVDNEQSETYDIKVKNQPLPIISLNSFTKQINNKIYNFSTKINNSKQPLNPKLYNIKFISNDNTTIAYIPDNSFEIRDYNDNKIGAVRNLADGTTQFILNNSFDLKIDSIVVGHKNSVTANKYIINTHNNSLHHVLVGSFFANEISTRERLMNQNLNALKEIFTNKINTLSTEITNAFTATNQNIDTLRTSITQVLNTKFSQLNTKFDGLQRKFDAFKTKYDSLDQFVRDNIATLSADLQTAQNNIRNLKTADATINTSLRALEQKYETINQNLTNFSANQTKISTDIQSIQANLHATRNQMTELIKEDGIIETINRDIQNVTTKYNNLLIANVKTKAFFISQVLKNKPKAQSLANQINALTTQNIQNTLQSVINQSKSLIDNNPAETKDTNHLNTEELNIISAIHTELESLKTNFINPTPTL